jgi:hypothetical protein
VLLALAAGGPARAAEAAAPARADSLAAAASPTHPAQLTPLTAARSFPRCTPAELAAAGYPDPLHAPGYPGYEPFTDADGVTYGPRSLVRGRVVIPREGLHTAPGQITYRGIRLTFDTGYAAWQMMPMMEMLDWARRDVAALLDHDRPDTLRVLSPVDLDAYRELTGHAYHRLLQWQEDRAVIEPAPILHARGLAAHAARQLVTRWLVDDLAGGHALPAWLTRGLAWYLAENGTHFLNYVAMYRASVEVVLPPADVEAVLGAAPHADDETDKLQFRLAGYSAFLMVWELVEHRGGLAPVRTFLQRVGAGEDPDAVSGDLWGHDLAALAAELDPTTRPEPVGDAVQPRTPHRPPGG